MKAADTQPVIIGSEQDSHVAPILRELKGRGFAPVVVDAVSIETTPFAVGLSECRLGPHVFAPTECVGWLRRIAPSDLQARDAAGSRADRAFKSRLRLLASICRLSGTRWLTHLDRLNAAEDRIYQLQQAQQLGIDVPPTVVASDPTRIREQLGSDVVLKPLGPGSYVAEDGNHFAAFTSQLTDEIEHRADFSIAPFLAQQRLDAKRHFRVVTALGVSRAAQLLAADLPLDWRRSEVAHQAWSAVSLPVVEGAALALADRLQLGFTSQDWIEDRRGGFYFVDLNPAGQWMFLPDGVAEPVTELIVDFLSGERH